MSQRFSIVGHLGFVFFVAIVSVRDCKADDTSSRLHVLQEESFRKYAEYFQRMEPSSIQQAIPDGVAWEWMQANIPFFECPQDNFEEIYYFRWWSLRKHIRETPSGYAFTEFLVPRSYADKFNLISCALGHHVMEARWIADPKFLNQYLHVWFRGNDGAPLAKLHKFSSWAPYALLQKVQVDGDRKYVLDMLPDMKKEYAFWEAEHVRPDGLFWQFDVRDGMEEQISGSRTAKNARPTINSYMVGNTFAMSRFAEMAGDKTAAERYAIKYESLRQLVLSKLWNAQSQFFEAVDEHGNFAGVREQIGFVPWYFRFADDSHDGAWAFAKSEKAFLSPFGLTTAERNHPKFRSHGCCNCEWDGPVWPFATSQTLTGMANRLHRGDSVHINKSDYLRQLELYVECHYHRGRPYIGEYLDEITGYWLKGDQERSRFYNHSTFCDLIITGLVGLCPSENNQLEIHPLLPDDRWDWFCLDGVPYRNHAITILWDRYGTKYSRGRGLHVFVDGKPVAHANGLERIVCSLPSLLQRN